MRSRCLNDRIRCQEPCRIGLQLPTAGPRNLLAVVATFACVLSPSMGAATTWHVPGGAPTIQAAIDSSQTGDDVLVAPGTYPEHDIVMKGGIRVHSEQGPGVTTVDAQNLGRGFTCTDIPDEATIEGFTIMNGRTTGPGGGIRAVRADLRIQACVITACRAQMEGGGVSAEESSMQISDSEITSSRAEGSSVALGGGGVACTRGNLVVQNSVIADCFTWQPGGGVGGRDSSIRLVDCRIERNHSWTGGGVASDRATQLSIERCLISWNRGICVGGGVFCYGLFDIVDSQIVENKAIECGQGWALVLIGSGRITGCTVAGNWGYGARFVIQIEEGDVLVERTIVAFHDGGDAFSCYHANVTYRCCDVYANRDNELYGDDLVGNFSADPIFCDAANGDYTLDTTSPCLPGNHPTGVDCGLVGARGQGCGTLPPSGACCFADGSCLVLGGPACADQQGVYMGAQTSCDSNPCEPTPVQTSTWGRVKAVFR